VSGSLRNCLPPGRMLRTTRVALAMPLALSLYWSTVYRPIQRHDRGLVFGSERLLLLLLIFIAARLT
jgi:hypothetical protein